MRLLGILKQYIISLDTIIAAGVTAVVILLLPCRVSGILVSEWLSMGISVLSIVFSIFFATLAFIISATDNEFIRFLEKNGDFTSIVNTFKWTLLSLFVSLIYSILLYGFVSYRVNACKGFVLNEWFMGAFVLMFFYSLVATILSTNDAIKFSEVRTKFIKKINDV